MRKAGLVGHDEVSLSDGSIEGLVSKKSEIWMSPGQVQVKSKRIKTCGCQDKLYFS